MGSMIDLENLFALIQEVYESMPDVYLEVFVEVNSHNDGGGSIRYKQQKGKSIAHRGCLGFQVTCESSNFKRLCCAYGIRNEHVYGCSAISLDKLFVLVREVYESNPDGSLGIGVHVGYWDEGGRITYCDNKGNPSKFHDWDVVGFSALHKTLDLKELCKKHGFLSKSWAILFCPGDVRY